MKVLVTGGGGFIGLALVRRLVELGFDVSTFSRKIYPEHEKSGVNIFQGDLANLEEFEKACKGNEVVFHVAAKAGIWGSYKKFYQPNVKGTENVIRACIKNRVQKLIFTSSASVIFDNSHLEGVDESMEYPEKPVSNYTATKAMAEQLVLNANSNSFTTISLRPHLVWGPGDTQLIPGILKRAKTGRLRKIGKKDFLIDTTYIDNLIDAQILALKMLDENPAKISGEAFFITNAEPVSVWTFINSILQSAEMQPVKNVVPKYMALFIAWIFENIYIVFRLKSEPFITRFAIYELCSHHWFDISAARTMLGYKPKVDFNKGIKRLKEFLNQK